MTLADLVINLTAETAAFTRKLDEAHRDAKRFADNVTGAFTRAGDTIKAAVSVLGLYKIGAEFAQLGAQAFGAAEQLVNMSEKVGISIETLSAMRYAARLADTDFGGLTAMVAKFNNNITLLPENTRQALRVLLGADWEKQVRGWKSTEEGVLAVADALGVAKESAAKTAVEMALFGRGGAEFAPLLNHLRELMTRAQQTGNVIAGDTARKMEAFGDKLEEVKLRVESLARGFLEGLIPSVETFVDRLEGSAGRADKSWAKLLGQGTGWTLGKGAEFFGGAGLMANEAYLRTRLAGLEAGLKSQEASFALGTLPGGERALVDMRGRIAEARLALMQFRELRDELLEVAPVTLPALVSSHGPGVGPVASHGGKPNQRDIVWPAAAPPDLSPQIQAFQSALLQFQVQIAKANDDLVGQIQAQWTDRLDKLGPLFAKLPAKLQEQFGPAYRTALGRAFKAEIAEIAEADQKLLEHANKAFQEWTKDQGLPQFVAPVPQIPALRTDIAGANLDRFRADLEAQNKLAEEVMQGALGQAQRYTVELAKLDTLLTKGAIDQHAYNRAVGDLRNKLDVNTIAMREFSEQSVDALKQSLLFSGDWHNALKTILVDLAEMILKMTVLKQLNQAGAGGGGWLGALVGGIVGAFGGGIPAGQSISAPSPGAIVLPPPALPPSLYFHAAGGRFGPNDWMLVGERGPEIIPPLGRSGEVIPSHKLGAGANVQEQLTGFLLNRGMSNLPAISQSNLNLGSGTSWWNQQFFNPARMAPHAAGGRFGPNDWMLVEQLTGFLFNRGMSNLPSISRSNLNLGSGTSWWNQHFNPDRMAPRASGGPVIAGQGYMVGEHGPEPFIPGVNGTILPNGSSRGSIVNNFHYTIDARGAGPGERERMVAALRQTHDAAVRDAVTAMAQIQRRA